MAHSEDRRLGRDIEELKLRAESTVHALIYCTRYRWEKEVERSRVSQRVSQRKCGPAPS